MKKILLVDDDASIRFIYTQELQDEGYTVVEAKDGEEGLSLFEQERPDIVILDIQMPGMDGIEVLRQMKKMSSETPVILSSAFPEFKQNIGVWAAEEYVVKSSNLERLKEAVKRHID